LHGVLDAFRLTAAKSVRQSAIHPGSSPQRTCFGRRSVDIVMISDVQHPCTSKDDGVPLGNYPVRHKRQTTARQANCLSF